MALGGGGGRVDEQWEGWRGQARAPPEGWGGARQLRVEGGGDGSIAGGKRRWLDGGRRWREREHGWI